MALVLRALVCMTGEAQGQAGEGFHAACPAMSNPERTGRVQLQSMLWDRSYRYNHGQLALFQTSEWQFVPCISWRALSMRRVWCICPTLDIHHKFSESSCNDLFPLISLLFKAEILILCSIKKSKILSQNCTSFRDKKWWATCHY